MKKTVVIDGIEYVPRIRMSVLTSSNEISAHEREYMSDDHFEHWKHRIFMDMSRHIADMVDLEKMYHSNGNISYKATISVVGGDYRKT